MYVTETIVMETLQPWFQQMARSCHCQRSNKCFF
uniref:Uncharacterized protein n=1 Tax=Arundo donax TaxID=35708 RepID=A0A0A8Z5W1_ARUDO